MDIETIKKLAAVPRPTPEEAFKARLEDPDYRAFLHENDAKVRDENELLMSQQKRRA